MLHETCAQAESSSAGILGHIASVLGLQLCSDILYTPGRRDSSGRYRIGLDSHLTLHQMGVCPGSGLGICIHVICIYVVLLMYL